MRQMLTQNQQKVFKYLKQKIEDNAVSPTLREAAADLEISHAAVAQTLKTLENKEYIRREGRYSRTIHILDNTGDLHAAQRQKQIPVIGHIKAGIPMYSSRSGKVSLSWMLKYTRAKTFLPLKFMEIP